MPRKSLAERQAVRALRRALAIHREHQYHVSVGRFHPYCLHGTRRNVLDAVAWLRRVRREGL